MPQVQVSPSKADIDFEEIENNLLKKLKLESQQMQIDTQRALDKFTSVQNEIYLK